MPTIASRSVQPETRANATTRSPEAPVRRRSARQPFDAPSPPPSPARELALRALDVLRRARQASPPERWLLPAFVREVDLVRLHLTPVRTRAALASSFGRESFNVAAEADWPVRMTQSQDHPSGTQAIGSIGPVQVAYAMRWLELGDGHGRPAFRDWLAAVDEPVLR